MNKTGQLIGMIIRIMSGHSREFENEEFYDYRDEGDIGHDLVAPKTPQQNGAVERKNRTIQDMAKVMPTREGVPQRFWVDAANTNVHAENEKDPI